MMCIRKGPIPVPIGGNIILFESAKVWFWYVRCQKGWADGARL